MVGFLNRSYSFLEGFDIQTKIVNKVVTEVLVDPADMMACSIISIQVVCS